MTGQFGEALRRVADEVPAAVVPEDLFDRARARHRRRSAAVACTLAVVFVLLGVGYVVRPADTPWSTATGSASSGLPSRLAVPPLRTATVSQSAPGAAAMLFSGPAVRDDWNEGRMGVVAADADRYRVIDGSLFMTPGFETLLSPDGRYVWRDRELVDLTTGDASPAPAGDPLAFAPDGQRLAVAGSTSTRDASRYVADHVSVYDREQRTEVLRVGVQNAWVPPGRSAISPNDGQLAVQVRDEVWLARTADAGADRVAEPYRKLPLSGGRLAGSGAWSSDGRSVAILERSTCAACPLPNYQRTWRLVTRDVTTGQPVPAAAFPELRSATFVQVLGWRSADVAVALVGVPGPGAVDLPDNHDNAQGPYHDPDTEAVRLVLLRRGAAEPELLFQTPAGISELAVAADLAVAGAVRESGPPSFGPPHPYLLAGGGILLLVLALPLGYAVIRYRRGQPTRRAP
ncbi:hypothetical protein [Micromonospora sp. NPDC000018]|uniref:hypothetical protein n=1 Tax=Micromonospora sp. NPDC000018 TaxID=3154239 RepID=UPI00332F2CDD